MKTTKVIQGILLFVCNFSALAAMPEVWNMRSSPSSSPLNGVAWGNGLFVAVGNDTTILTSANGAVWTAGSAGTTAPTLYTAAYGNGRYVLGGEQSALIRSSTDGINWTNGLSALGLEHIQGLTFAYGLFVAVGGGAQANTSLILTSSNGLDWISQSAPTTNTLLAISPAFGPNGIGWADNVLVAVGEHGTIITSSNGVNWVPHDSGTTVTLRAAAFDGRLVVAGDSGVVLVSSDGASWPPAAPTSFDIHGLASSGDGALVAVGNYSTAGRLQVSPDGLTWPGSASEFAQPLNAITFGAGSFVVVGNGGLILQSATSTTGATNEWTKTTSGYWEEPFWSLGQLPARDQALIAFRNPGFKALAIGQNTTANFSNSLAINSLTIEAPPNSFNQLLLNFAGLEVPLSVASDLNLGTNGSLVGYYSALRGGNFYLSAPATFAVEATVMFSNIVVGVNAPAELDLTNASLSASRLLVGQGAAGTLTQSGGVTCVSSLQIPGLDNTHGDYFLSDGTLTSSNLSLGAVLSPSTPPGRGNFFQSGGVHTNASMELAGEIREQAVTHFGSYSLNAGLLASGVIHELSGAFTQSGGTNLTQELVLDEASSFVLNNGDLVTSNTTLDTCCCVRSDFVQNNGSHSVQNRLLLQDFVRYELRDGTLAALNIELGPGAEFRLLGGVISNPGLFTIRGGALRTGGQTQQLGQLQVIGILAVTCFGLQTTTSTLDLGPATGTGATVIHFQDSRDVPWSGSALSILNWSPATNGFGPAHIFVGTNSQALTSSQVDQLTFVNPVSWPPGNYPARMLSTGEIIPGVPPPIGFARASNTLILTWGGDYQLLAAANVTGPYLPVTGASSPLTNTFAGAQRYFRLALPAP